MSSLTYALEAVNLAVLDTHLRAGEYTIDYDGAYWVQDSGMLTVLFIGEPSEDDAAAVTAIIEAHDPAYVTLEDRIIAARRFGVGLINQYQELMITEGVVQAGKAHDIATKLRDSLILAQAGNLYALDVELSLVEPEATFLEQSRIDTIRNEVRATLGLAPI